MCPWAAGRLEWPLAVASLLDVTLAIHLLQWNPHWECFTQDKYRCKENAEESLTAELVRGDIDFANVIELEDETYVVPNGWKATKHKCGLDVIHLIYNINRWGLLAVGGSTVTGCMEHEDRPFIVQVFVEGGTGGSKRKVVVVGAHYPHTKERAELRNALSLVIQRSGVSGVILIADTNEGHSVSNDDVMRDINAPVGHIASTALYSTCCYSNHFDYNMTYDRIIANFGSGMTTSVLFDSLPEWAHGSFHKGIRGTLHEAKTTRPLNITLVGVLVSVICCTILCFLTFLYLKKASCVKRIFGCGRTVSDLRPVE